MEYKFNKSEKYDTSLEELQFRFDDEEELQMNAIHLSIYHQMNINLIHHSLKNIFLYNYLKNY